MVKPGLHSFRLGAPVDEELRADAQADLVLRCSHDAQSTFQNMYIGPHHTEALARILYSILDMCILMSDRKHKFIAIVPWHAAV